MTTTVANAIEKFSYLSKEIGGTSESNNRQDAKRAKFQENMIRFFGEVAWRSWRRGDSI